MTDLQQPAPPHPAPAAPTAPRWMKVVLAVSVALNLAVVGLALGARLGDGPHRGMPRDMSFGPFSDALTAEDRRALRRALIDREGEFRTARDRAKMDFADVVAALRAEPFDPAALAAALTALETRNAERLQLGRKLIETRLVEMAPAERLAFADRLEEGLNRGKKD